MKPTDPRAVGSEQHAEHIRILKAFNSGSEEDLDKALCEATTLQPGTVTRILNEFKTPGGDVFHILKEEPHK